MLNLFTWNELQIYSFFFVLLRVTSFIFFLPIFGDRTVPLIIKTLFGLAFSFVVFPLGWVQGNIGFQIPAIAISSTWNLISTVGSEILFGMMVGFAARWIFDAVQGAGHFAAANIGFSMASVLDPQSEVQTVALAELQYLMAALLFLSLDGHHIYLNATLQSFTTVPLGTVNFFGRGESVIQYLMHMSGEVIVLAVKLSAPALVVILILNLAFGIIARAVPQMNPMAVSFSANVAVGIFVVIVSFPGFMNMLSGAFDVYTPELFRFMRLFHG